MIVETNKNASTGKYEVGIKATGVVAELEANKEVSIDVSNYNEPVEITPTSGKNGMAKATVTLTNIPSGGVSKLYAWKITGDEYIYYTTKLNLSAGDYLITISITGNNPNSIEIASYDETTHIATDIYETTYEYYASADINLS